MEMLDIIDIKGNKTNLQEDRKIVHKKGLLHHASGVVFIRKNKNSYEILSQQRSFNKDKNAGLWDMSASGHVPSNESPLNSLLREIEEELGINVTEQELFLLGKFWRNETYSKDFIENELDYIYVCEKDLPINKITIQKEEVEDVQWISTDNFKILLNNGNAVKRKDVWDCLFKYLENKMQN